MMFHCVIGASNTTIEIIEWTKPITMLHELFGLAISWGIQT
jgi:hypothetical protein